MDARTRLTEFSPIFPVSDLRRALDHYAALGFDTHPYADGDEYECADRDGSGGTTRSVGDTDYKLRDGAHFNPDNNLIRFGSPIRNV